MAACPEKSSHAPEPEKGSAAKPSVSLRPFDIEKMLAARRYARMAWRGFKARLQAMSVTASEK